MRSAQEKLKFKWQVWGLLLISSFLLLGCDDPVGALLKSKESITLTVTTNMPTGRYQNLPTSIQLSFPDTVDMESVDADDFQIADSCANTDVEIGKVSVAKQVATINLNEVADCENGEKVTLSIRYKGIDLTSDKHKAVGKESFVYTLDTVAPNVTASVKNVSGIATNGIYAFSSAVTQIVYTFSDDVKLSSVTKEDFEISGGTGSDCATLPTINSITRVSQTSSVTVKLAGGVCSDGESFKITLKQQSVEDQSLSGGTGKSLPNKAPSSNFTLTLLYAVTVPSVTSVGGGSTTDSGIYPIASSIDIVVGFSEVVEVTGTPRIRLNLAGTKYAIYVSGSGSDELLFRYTVEAGAPTTKLEYYGNSALSLNGGTIYLAGSGGTVPANITLPTPGAANSLSFTRTIELDVVPPTVLSNNPSGSNYSWGTGQFQVSFTMSEPIKAASLTTSDLTVTSGTCGMPPTVTDAEISGATNNIITFTLSDNACGDGQTYNLRFNPVNITDVPGNPGFGSARDILITAETDVPTVNVSAPSKSYVNSEGSLTYTVYYSGATSVSLSDSDISFLGSDENCVPQVSGSGVSQRSVTITGCTGDGVVKIAIAEETAINVYGNLALAVDESEIVDFVSDNTELPDPTDSLSLLGGMKVYDLDEDSSIDLTFADDVLGNLSALTSTIELNCGGNPVAISLNRVSHEILRITPNEASPDFNYGADCELSGQQVPDAAGNTHDFSGVNFWVTQAPLIVSGPSSTINLGAAELGDIIFNVSLNPATINAFSVNLSCDTQPVEISNFILSNNDKELRIDFNEFDVGWQALQGGENCILEIMPTVENTFGQALASPAVYNITVMP